MNKHLDLEKLKYYRYISFVKGMFEQTCFTFAVEASFSKQLVVNRVLDACKSAESLVKIFQIDRCAMLVSAASLFIFSSISFQRHISHVMTKDVEAVGKMFFMLVPGGVPRFPAT